MAESSLVLRSGDNLSDHSFAFFSTSYVMLSSRLRESISPLRFLSSAAFFSASFTILSMSASERPLEDSMRIFCSFDVALSFAETCRMPFASMSNVTSTCGIPRGAGGIPVSWNLPMVRLSEAICRSPWSTWIATVVWLSPAEHHDPDQEVGDVLHRGGQPDDGRDRGVPRDKDGGDPTQCLDAQ